MSTPKMNEPEKVGDGNEHARSFRTAFSTDPTKRLAAGYKQQEQLARDERVQARKNERDEFAARFTENPHLEAVLKLRQSAPQDFDRMNVGAMRIQISGYERDRNAFYKTGEYSKAAMEALSEQISLEARLAELDGIAQGGAPGS